MGIRISLGFPISTFQKIHRRILIFLFHRRFLGFDLMLDIYNSVGNLLPGRLGILRRLTGSSFIRSSIPRCHFARSFRRVEARSCRRSMGSATCCARSISRQSSCILHGSHSFIKIHSIIAVFFFLCLNWLVTANWIFHIDSTVLFRGILFHRI